jgi:hypothetical protein
MNRLILFAVLTALAVGADGRMLTSESMAGSRSRGQKTERPKPDMKKDRDEYGVFPD